MTKSDQVFGEEADDQAQAGPRAHPPVKQPQLGRAGLELQEAQRGAETTAASGLVPPALARDLPPHLQRAAEPASPSATLRGPRWSM